MKRRDLLKTLAAVPQLLRGKPSRPPNVLFVLSDDHSYPYLGAYGADWLSTPNLDQFAREGLLFQNAFTAAPQCVPSRTAIMSGRSPVAARMGRFSSPLPADIPVAPELLRTRGYYTGVAGRYFHLDGVVNPTPTTGTVYDDYGLRTWKRRVDFLDISSQAQTTGLFDQFLTAAPASRPWFFWANYSDPHHPWDKETVPRDRARVQVPPHLPDLPGVRDDLARYGGEIERADRSFGELMSVLRKHGQEAGTLVLFMGDNGMAFPHGKGSLYDPGLHVPLIARWPGHVKPGVTNNLISGEDLAATFLDAGCAAAPTAMTGRSFYPLLTGAHYNPRDYVFGARFHHGNSPFTPQSRADTFDLSRCVRSARFKLIYNVTPDMEYWPVDSANDPGWQQILAAHRGGSLRPEYERAYFHRRRPVLELYDLEKDPAELNNLAGHAEYRDQQAALSAALQEKMILDQDFVPPVLEENVPRQPAPAPRR
ncbi:MAG TPA: sulfatase [Paludibaculum sp.]|jgi:arylsulfatase A-like enzyme